MIKVEEEIFISNASRFLDRPSLLLRLANSIGKPVELAVQNLPAKQKNAIHRATESALHKGLLLLSKTVGTNASTAKSFAQSEQRSRKLGLWHSAASFGLGAVGGFFGFVSLPIELPLTTALILRSIAAIADEFGMDLNDPRTQLECLYILSLGSPHKSDDGAFGSGYWGSRATFATLTKDAASLYAASPVLVKFIARVASRFEIVVSEKILAEALPVVGAIGGGAVNAAFTNYFSEAARFHFGLRALEIKHGQAVIQKIYKHNKEIS